MNGQSEHYLRIALIFGAGGLGALSRHGLGILIHRIYGGSFPVGTLVINLLGCLFFGFISALAVERRLISHETQLILLTGFMGAFTTFSTFAYDTHLLLRTDGWLWALANVALQCIGGVVAVAIGIAVARYIPA